MVETAQSNGVAEIQYPHSGFSYFAMFASIGVLLFGVTLSFANLGEPRKGNISWGR